MRDELQPPFLELSYFVGRETIEEAFELFLTSESEELRANKARINNLIGVTEKQEILEARGGILNLRTEDQIYDVPKKSLSASDFKLGQKIYNRFLEVADLIDPIYGAILIEYTLEEPDELASAMRSLAFHDFFLSAECFSESVVEAVVRSAGSAVYIERRPRGIYVSMSEVFNPNRSGIPGDDAEERSDQIAEILGRALKSTW